LKAQTEAKAEIMIFYRNRRKNESRSKEKEIRRTIITPGSNSYMNFALHGNNGRITDAISPVKCFKKENGRMAGGAGRRTSTSFEAMDASSATGIPNLVR